MVEVNGGAERESGRSVREKRKCARARARAQVQEQRDMREERGKPVQCGGEKTEKRGGEKSSV